MQDPFATQARPSRAQIEHAALELLSRHSAGLLATARRYSASPEDAEDAYQRGVEILLTKAPTTTETDLLPWLKTVVKHEAFAVSKATTRAVPADEALAFQTDETAWTDQRAERYERLRVGAEAMAGLKPQEIRCLLLKAEGLSYEEICEATGFSYTKVNRCLTEGRRAFLKRVAGIEAGAECERLTPLISKMADGEASPDEMRVVRPHLKGCLACKATLRTYRETPGRLAGLVPPVVALAGGGGGTTGILARLVDRFAWIGDRFAALGDRIQGMGDTAGAKAAAVAASAVVIAGGGAAGIDAIHHDAPAVEPSAYAVTKTPSMPPQAPPAGISAPAPAASQPPDPSTAAIDAVSSLPERAAPEEQPPAPARASKPDPKPAAPAPAEPTPEFDPGTSVGPGAAAPDPQPREFSAPQPVPQRSVPLAAKPPTSTASPGGGAIGEFGP